MDNINWDPDLIIDSGQLRGWFSYLFDEKQIQLKVNICGLSNDDWVYAQWPMDCENNFRFAINILTGKFIVLFIESGDKWLTKEWKQLLIKGLEGKFKRGGEVVLCGNDLMCFGWFNQEYDQRCKENTVAGLLQGYRELW